MTILVPSVKCSECEQVSTTSMVSSHILIVRKNNNYRELQGESIEKCIEATFSEVHLSGCNHVTGIIIRRL